MSGSASKVGKRARGKGREKAIKNSQPYMQKQRTHEKEQRVGKQQHQSKPRAYVTTQTRTRTFQSQ